MIFKGRCRTDGDQLGTYLLSEKNDQVRVVDIQGTVRNDATPGGLKSALKDFDQYTLMTEGKQGIFHLALNPDDRDRLRPQDWLHCVTKAEEALGLSGYPRAIVQHVYKGKEHMHVAYSRVDVDTAKMLEMPFYKLKLVQAAREVEIDLDLQKTPDRARGAHRLKQDVLNHQKHQAERTAHPKVQRDAILQDAWNQSGNGQEFKARIKTAGYQLAIGKRGHVVMDANLEPHSIARSIDGIKQKDVKAKLADLNNLPTVETFRADSQAVLARGIRDRLQKQFTKDNEKGMGRERENAPTGSTTVRRKAKDMTHDQATYRVANDNVAAADSRTSETLAEYRARKQQENMGQERAQRPREDRSLDLEL